LHNSDWRQDRKNVTNHMRVKIRKIGIKLKHNFMNINAYGKNYGGALCSKDSAVVFHPP
jgi:hypothetical protein